MSLQQQAFALQPTPPFDFTHSLNFIEHFAPSAQEQTLDQRVVRKAIRAAGQTVVVELQSTGTVDAPRLEGTLYASTPITPDMEHAALDRLRFYLSLEDDLRPFYRLAAGDSVFEAVIQRLYGYHQVKFLTPFENAVWAVLTQRNAMPIASNMKNALTQYAGNQLEVDGVVYRAFPDAHQLLPLSDTELREIIGHPQKATYLHAVIAAFAEADELWLRSAPTELVRAWLRNIRGIGEWSAAFILLRGLGHVNSFPANEARILGAFHQFYGRQDIQTIAPNYAEYQGYWAHYLRAAQ